VNILHVSSEVLPYSKTGGLGDVASALPRAEAAIGRALSPPDRVAVVTPAYRVDAARFALARRLRTVEVMLGGRAVEVGVLEGRLPGGAGEVHAWLVDHPCYRRAQLYGEGGVDYPDNGFRFALLGKAALAVARGFGFFPDVLHGHDWQACPALYYARGETGLRRVLTIHNLAFHGLFPPSLASEIDFAAEHYHPEGFEFWGQLSFLKAGIIAADRITTVSPQYAREVQTEAYGCGLDGFLRAHADRLLGILNGADYDVWNPARDLFLEEHYNDAEPAGKRACKSALQRACDLPPRPKTPLFGAVSRLTDQKGFDLVLEVLEKLLPERDLQAVVLGAGDADVEARFTSLAARFPARLAVRIGYDEALAHRIYGGSDFLLMPSRYEPCGLAQIYALRYGAIPIVRATGGLEDTVVDYDPRSQSGTGFKFGAPTAAALEAAWRRALAAFASDENFPALVRRAMTRDFSWANSARVYRSLYESIR
jgi:starch synthase